MITTNCTVFFKLLHLPKFSEAVILLPDITESKVNTINHIWLCESAQVISYVFAILQGAMEHF